MTNDVLADIKSRLNGSNMLTAVLHTLGSIDIDREELEEILKFNKPDHMMDLNVDDTYSEGFMDYIKHRGGYVSLGYDHESDKIKFTLMSREDAEKEMLDGKSMGFVCVRSFWNDYAHS